MPINTSDGFAFQTGTVSSTALALTDLSFTAAQVDQADVAFITCATQAVRYRYDGGDPTASVGHLLAVGESVRIEGSKNLHNLKLIRATGSDGAVSITLEKF